MPLGLSKAAEKFLDRNEVQVVIYFLRFLDNSGMFSWLKSTNITGKARCWRQIDVDNLSSVSYQLRGLGKNQLMFEDYH